MRSQNGFSLIESLIVLALSVITFSAVVYGFMEYRRQQTVSSAIELVGAVQRSAEALDASEPVNFAALASGLDPQFQSDVAVPPGSPSALLGGFHGGGIAYAKGGARGGYEIVLLNINKHACGPLVARIWPMVDGISAGVAGGSSMATLKNTDLGEEQATATSAAVRSACEDGSSQRRIVLAVMDGFPPALPTTRPPTGPGGEEQGPIVAPPDPEPLPPPVDEMY